MATYRARLLESLMLRRLRQFPVVVLAGARQTGKTTLVRRLPEGRARAFRTLDEMTTLETALGDPDALVAEANRMALDEVQRAPDLVLAVKRAVDRRRTRGCFVLTGSANLLLGARVSESLAGRAVYLNLRPMTETEKRGRPAPGPWRALLRAPGAEAALKGMRSTGARRWAWRRAVVEGGFPIPALERDLGARRAWFEGYVQTYVERDVRQLAEVSSTVDFRRLMRIAALRVGRLANQADLARDAGLSHATAHRWLNLLEASFLLDRVVPYSVSRTKRLIKMPKLFWTDSGLAAHLAGAHRERDLAEHECAGGLLKNLVLHHLRCFQDWSDEPVEVATWRTASGEEVDFVIEAGLRLLPIEVKSRRTLRSEDLRHVDSFLDEYGERAPFGLVLYDGEEPRLVTRRILALPLGAAIAPDSAP